MLFDERVFSSVALKRTSAIYLEETPRCRLRPLTLDKTMLGFLEPKTSSKIIVHTKIMYGWLIEVRL